jgi:hypothetical protein
MNELVVEEAHIRDIINERNNEKKEFHEKESGELFISFKQVNRHTI